MMNRLSDVFYVPGAEYGLFSPGLAAEQGLEFDYQNDTMNFLVSDLDHTVIVARPHDATWRFHVTHPSKAENVIPRDQFLANLTAAEGVATLERWHERLAHTCPQYLKTMADKGLVRGMMLTRQQLGTCEACHIGKQKQKPHRKKLDRKLKTPIQVVYADLLIPNKGNETRYEAVLVILDGFSRFVTIHLLTSKARYVVNKHMMEYAMWTERQAGRGRNGIERSVFNVQQVLTDKGGEFVNDAMKNWYAAHGIEHVLVGPKSSQLNLYERTHQSLVGMMKPMMYQSGLPRSLWSEALKNAVYIKNRGYNRESRASQCSV
jgi:transposase InsO family protein